MQSFVVRLQIKIEVSPVLLSYPCCCNSYSFRTILEQSAHDCIAHEPYSCKRERVPKPNLLPPRMTSVSHHPLASESLLRRPAQFR